MLGIEPLLEEAGITARLRSEVDLILEQRGQDYLDKTIASLPERQKVVLALRYYESLLSAEIAMVLGVREAQVEELLEKATHALCAKLARNAGRRDASTASGEGSQE